MMAKHVAVSVVTITLVVVILSFAAVAADHSDEVVTLLKTKTDAILGILNQTGLAKTEKRQQVLAVVDPVINFPLMAKLTLGKDNWARLSPEERVRFVDLFVERLKTSYLDKTSLYADLAITYEKAVEEAGKVSVPTRLKTKDKVIEVIYRFYSTEGQWQVYDVEIEGVSFIKSYRSQFDEILRNGTVNDLFAELNKTEAVSAPAVVEPGNQSQPDTTAGE